jgi:hypothetical protein
MTYVIVALRRGVFELAVIVHRELSKLSSCFLP